MSLIKYVGPYRPGVVVRDTTGDVYCPYDVSVSVSDDLEAALMAQQPDLWDDGGDGTPDYTPEDPDQYARVLVDQDDVLVRDDPDRTPIAAESSGVPDPTGEDDGLVITTEDGAYVLGAGGGGGGPATAADLPFVPAGGIAATDVQAAIEEAYDEAADEAIAAVEAATLSQIFGARNGETISPWDVTPTFGDEQWATTHMDSGSGHLQTVTPSLTANSTNQSKTVRVILNGPSWVTGQPTYRLEFDYNCPVGGIDVAIVTNSGGDVVVGARQQVVTATGERTSGRFLFDFQVPQVNGPQYLDVTLQTASTESSGSITITNGTLKQTGGVRRPLLIGKEAATSKVRVFTQQYRPLLRDWRIAALEWTAESVLTPYSFNQVDVFATDRMFPLGYPDPAFVASYSGLASSPGSVGFAGGVAYGTLRINNNDQIFYLRNVAGDGYEYRGNTHGGETVRGSASWKLDYGAGLVAWTASQGLLPARRAQLSLPTRLARTDEVGGEYFANVDHTFTMFPDGLIRCDRTTTFLKDVVINTMFEWMSSHNPGGVHIGRIGAGLDIQGEYDTCAKAATPATPTITTNTLGGALPAATYSYRVAARTAHGETRPSTAATVAATGTTSRNTITWASVTGATAYAIYGRTAGYERLLAVVGSAATGWTDDGSAGGTAAPRDYSTARRAGTAVTADGIASGDAAWGVYYDPDTEWAIANIYDRDTVLDRSGVDACWTKMECIGGAIQKNYAILGWDGVDNHPVASGTVWNATHWTYVYRPNDTAVDGDWHREAAVRAVNLNALQDLYPAV